MGTSAADHRRDFDLGVVTKLLGRLLVAFEGWGNRPGDEGNVNDDLSFVNMKNDKMSYAVENGVSGANAIAATQHTICVKSAHARVKDEW